VLIVSAKHRMTLPPPSRFLRSPECEEAVFAEELLVNPMLYASGSSAVVPVSLKDNRDNTRTPGITCVDRAGHFDSNTAINLVAKS
jgi:hypothetical protein